MKVTCTATQPFIAVFEPGSKQVTFKFVHTMLHATRLVAWLLLSFLCLFSNTILAINEAAAFSYIEMYKDIAIQERIRTGIPASITLAQGLFESGKGGSELAVEANNHFGIKCKNTWEGESHYVKDDDYDANGRLIESCFRKYGSAEESYRDHSDFLTSSSRYSELFLYAASDYKAWAKGLKRCGYATNPEYAQKLIELIDRYELYLYDRMEPEQQGLVIEPNRQTLTEQPYVQGTYNPEVEILPNDPNAPAAYSVADYVRNSYNYVDQQINTSTIVNPPVEQAEEANRQNSWELPPTQHANLAQTSTSAPVPAQKEVLSAPMYDIEYYELTEKGLGNQAESKQHVKESSSPVSSLRFHPRKQQFKRRGN